FSGQPAQVPDRQHRAFQVIEQAKTQRQIKPPELRDSRILQVAPLERDLRKPIPRLRDIFRPRVEASRAQPAFLKNAREKSNAAASIQPGAQSQRRLQRSHYSLD